MSPHHQYFIKSIGKSNQQFCYFVLLLSCVWLFETTWTAVHQASLSSYLLSISIKLWQTPFRSYSVAFSNNLKPQKAFSSSSSFTPSFFFLLLLFYFLLFLYLPPLSLFSSLSLLPLPLLLLAFPPPPPSFLTLSQFKSYEESQSIIQVEVELLRWMVEYRNLSLTSKVAPEWKLLMWLKSFIL